MREIKFRAWDGSGMCYQNEVYFVLGKDNYWAAYLYGNNDVSYFEKDGTGDCVLMQYVGLKDKNGVEIYEGDIIRDYWDNVYEPMVFKKGRFCIPLSDDFMDELTINYIEGCEIIGNIYENPELK